MRPWTRPLVAAALLAASLGVAAALVARRVAAALPAGFTDVTVAQPQSNPLSRPTSITALPDGRALILEQGGAVRVLLADGTLSATDALTLSVCTDSEEGLLGAAVDGNFAADHFVYLYYSHNAGNCASSTGRFNRVSRFVMQGNTIDGASELVLLDNMSIPAGNHNGGDLEVAKDGFLYVSVGDGGANPRGLSGSAGRDLSLLNGKILRITTTGGVPADNPFVGQSGATSCATAGISTPTSAKCTEIFAFGLRNPFRFAFDPNSATTRFFLNDVGEVTWEEVDDGGKGRDYGWDVREGFCLKNSSTNCPPPSAGMTDPLTAYNHSTGCTFITAAAFVPNGVWPSAFDGAYLFADGGCGKIWVRTPAGAVDYANPFTTTSGVIVDMAFIPRGAGSSLYYATNGSGQLHQIVTSGPPPPPPPPPPSPAAADFTALTPARLADTRPGEHTVDGRFAGGGALAAGTVSRLDVAGRAGVAVDATAVALTVTVTATHADGYVTVFPCDAALPVASNLNYAAGATVAGAVVARLAPDGSVCLYTLAATDVVVDVGGYVPRGGDVIALAPRRALDTRPGMSTADGLEQGIGVRSAGSTTAIPIGGRVDVPTDVSAVVLVVTATDGAVPGYVSAFPCGGAPPTASTVNVVPGRATANLAVSKVGPGGSVCLFTLDQVHLVVDVVGYMPPDASYSALAPARLVETRTGFSTVDGQFNAVGAVGAGANIELPVIGRGGVPAPATAVVLNVTVTGPSAAGFVVAFPCGSAMPLASNVNFVAGQTVADSVIVAVGQAGKVCLAPSATTDVVVDVTGAFTS